LKSYTFKIGKYKFVLSTKVSKGILVIFYFAIAIALSEKAPRFRQLFYLTLPLIITLFTYSPKLLLNTKPVIKDFYIFTLLWIVFASVSLFFGIGKLDYVRWFKEFYFIITAILSVALIFSISNVHNIEKGIKLLVLLVFFLVVLLDTSKLLLLLKLDIYNLLVNSASETESGLSFVAGTCILFFFTRKNKLFMLLSVIMLVLGSKRIAILAVLLCIVFYYIFNPLYQRFKTNKNLFALLFTLLNLLILTFLTNLAYGNFNDLIQNLFGIPPNFLFMGRVNLFSAMLDLTEGLPIVPKGLAYTTSVLESGALSHKGITLKLMHSDILKYSVELGLPFYTILIFFLYRLASGNIFSVLIVLYYTILMITDNITIYFEVMFLMYLTLMFFKVMQNKDKYNANNHYV